MAPLESLHSKLHLNPTHKRLNVLITTATVPRKVIPPQLTVLTTSSRNPVERSIETRPPLLAGRRDREMRWRFADDPDAHPLYRIS